MSFSKETITKIEELAKAEYENANEKYPPFHSIHEGFAVLAEEYDETKSCNEIIENLLKTAWENVKHDDFETLQNCIEHIRKNAVLAVCEDLQVIAMCDKFKDFLRGVDDETAEVKCIS